MFRKLTAKKLFKVVLILALLGMLVFLNPRDFFNPFRSAILSAAYPFQKIFYAVSLKISYTKDFLFCIGDIKRENEELIRKNQELLADNSLLRDIKRENEILREQLELAPRGEFNLEPAMVVGQDLLGSGNWIIIDKGRKDGIESGMAVIVSRGILIGKVEEVFPLSSRVILLNSPQCAVNATVNGSDIKGIIRGEHGLGIIFDMVLQTDELKAGDEIVTSGTGGTMPKGLLVGNVQEVRSGIDRLFQQAVVYPPVKFSKLQTIFVIKSQK